jgi:hypothetical protein
MSEKETLQIQVPVSAEDVDSAFAKILLQSKLGEQIGKAIANTVGKGQYSSMNRLITEGVETAVKRQSVEIVNLLLQDHLDVIKEKVAEILTPDLIAKIVEKFWNRAYADL